MSSTLIQALESKATLESKVIDFDSIYDVSYFIESQEIMLYDLKTEVYFITPWFKFVALLNAYYDDKEMIDRIINSVLNFKSVRIIPHQRVAGIKPVKEVNYLELILNSMKDTVDLTFKDDEQKREFYLSNYGINLL